jgi:nitronate monooxygenase
MSTLNETIPWASSPLIINAPMADNAGGALASAVTLAGGFGMIGTKFKVEKARSELEIARKIFASHAPLSTANTLPVGIGFLPIINKLEDAIPVIAEFRPAVVWLFGAPKLAHYATWTEAVRTASPDSKVWIQLGSVAAAVQVGKQAKPDALCLQGADAGGHGFVKGASIVSLVPEATDVLEREGMGNIPLLASGGIVDGRGVAAALALGAQGVVMGTRFLAAEEVLLHPAYQAAILEAQDGGQVTRRSKLFDQLYGPNIWPEEYDGRSLVMRSYRDFHGKIGQTPGDSKRMKESSSVQTELYVEIRTRKICSHTNSRSVQPRVAALFLVEKPHLDRGGYVRMSVIAHVSLRQPCCVTRLISWCYSASACLWGPRTRPPLGELLLSFLLLRTHIQQVLAILAAS